MCVRLSVLNAYRSVDCYVSGALGPWHTYGYNDCRMIEAAFLAVEAEVILGAGQAAPQKERATVSLGSRY